MRIDRSFHPIRMFDDGFGMHWGGGGVERVSVSELGRGMGTRSRCFTADVQIRRSRSFHFVGWFVVPCKVEFSVEIGEWGWEMKTQ
ncbi:hypothetical protein CDAR_537431 [Caerostris darwini]|uniref:Uncharacterized protein n=1 Tax=Caerostris darwini TaxID=1538125 RepID=A0AAV4Q8M6_9ARAC|nr:hypothetical protein CDAR_537431 [Caerostris darwini]